MDAAAESLPIIDVIETAPEAPRTDPATLTPLMKQYRAIKSQNPSTVLLYRMGDFYEMFDEDARIASRVLGLTLTKRNQGAEDDTPLAGFPHHALDRYANRLVRAGHRIAICEQTEDPKKAKGLVKRDVIEVISAGTATDDTFIDQKTNNFIMGLASGASRTGIAVCDLSTGVFWIEEIDPLHLDEELARTDPSEVLVAGIDNNPLERTVASQPSRPVVTRYDGWKFDPETARDVLRDHFGVVSLEGLGLDGFGPAICAAGALLSYLKEQKKNRLAHITRIVPRTLSEYAELDAASIRNLELLKPLNAEDTQATLHSVLDRTSTAMGGRQLKQWITHPLRDIDAIEHRLNAVAWLRRDVFARGELGLALKSIADIERLIGRVVYERANARDVLALRLSVETFPRIVKALADGSDKSPQILHASAALTGFDDVAADIARTIADSPPLSVREGGIIRPGVSPELDELRDAAVNGKKWIAALQATERERTGISSLKVGFNKVFGYYIEISKANQSSVPTDYIRKQTLANGERFITPELKEMEEKILGAEEKLSVLEYDVFVALRTRIAARCADIQNAAEAIALLDVLVSLATSAAEQNYVRPTLRDNADMIIKDGRHPVIERMIAGEQFVPNDTRILGDETRILLITGPNMAGKSTYLRQNALIAVMAQMGSFVPAAQAEIGIVDKFYTRVGASDRLARGQSTFLVEMIEVANILNNATGRSLVLLDEVGRGTSTFDGISIAWAVAEYLHESANGTPRTFFATHYHELTELALLFPRIRNLHVKVKEWNDSIIFLRKIDEGSCDHSYGIQVARLAGVPKEVIVRAKEILSNLERMELTPDQKPALARHGKEERRSAVMQTELFSDPAGAPRMDARVEEIVKSLRHLDTNNLTPMQALMELESLRKLLPRE